MAKKKKRSSLEKSIESGAVQLTHWLGTPWSVLFHTLIFIGSFATLLLGVDADTVLLVLTTIVSLEAIYLSLFIQMSVNRQAAEIAEVGKDLDEISEDVEHLEDLREDVEDLTEDLDRMAKEDDEYELAEEKKDQQTSAALQSIENHLISVAGAIKALEEEIETLRKRV